MHGLTLVYDEENRLIESSDPTRRTRYIYDGFGRRVERLDYVNGVLTGHARFVYDGWRVVEELDQSYSTTKSYTRGLDLSKSFEGAGGIGGLLAFLQQAMCQFQKG